MNNQPKGAGKSSLDLINRKQLLDALPIKKGDTILDLACGYGNYALAFSRLVGTNGKIIALDLWEEGIRYLKNQIITKHISNIKTLIADAGKPIPIETGSIDICLVATVFHDFVLDQIETRVLNEIIRILKPNGRLAIIEFKKIEGPPGPSKEIRLSPRELLHIIAPYGFQMMKTVEVGEFNYFTLFSKK